ncbi:MAG: hypothetical protein ACFHX7_03075 [Pseudomonadota bacterium]
MDVAVLARSTVLFLFFAVILGMNLDDNLFARLGLAGNYGLTFFAAVLFTLFMIGRNIYIVAAVALLCLVANMPADFSLNFGYDRDYYAGLMAALLIQPLIARLLD